MIPVLYFYSFYLNKGILYQSLVNESDPLFSYSATTSYGGVPHPYRYPPAPAHIMGGRQNHNA